MRFRHYQIHGFSAATSRRWRFIYLCWAVASGKTAFTHAYLAEVFRNGWHSHAVIVGPYEPIRNGFDTSKLGDDKREFCMGGVTVRAWAGMVRELKRGSSQAGQAGRIESTVRELVSYLLNPRPTDEATGRPYAVSVCTQTALQLILHMDQLPADMSHVLFVIDEAQGIGADCTNRVVNTLISRGTRFILASGSPYRDDNRNVLPDPNDPDVLILSRSLAEQIHEGYAPRVKFEVEVVDCDGDTYESRQQQMIDHVVADFQPGQKKVIRAVPARGAMYDRDGEDADADDFSENVDDVRVGVRLRDLALRAFTERGLRFRDATSYPGNHGDDWLESERRVRDFNDSEVDVVWGINRIYCGMDWALANTVCCLDFPTTLPLIVQLLGRGMRYKGGRHGGGYANYPEQYLERTLLKIYVPGRRDGSERFFRHDMAQVAVKIGAVLATVALPDGLTAKLDMHRALRSPLSDASVVEGTGRGSANESEIAEAASQHFMIHYGRRECTVGEARDQLMRAYRIRRQRQGLEVSDEDVEAINLLLHRFISERNERNPLDRESQRRMGEAHDRAVEAAARRHPHNPRRLVQEAYRRVIDEYSEMRIVTAESPLLSTIVRFVIDLDDGTAGGIAQRLEQESRPLHEQAVRHWAMAYWTNNGAFPDTDSGPVQEDPREDWSRVIAALQGGYRGLPSHPSVEDLVRSHQMSDGDVLHLFRLCPDLLPSDLTVGWTSDVSLQFYYDRYRDMRRTAEALPPHTWNRLVDYLLQQSTIRLGSLLNLFRETPVTVDLRARRPWYLFWHSVSRASSEGRDLDLRTLRTWIRRVRNGAVSIGQVYDDDSSATTVVV